MDMGHVVIRSNLPEGAVIRELRVPISFWGNMFSCDAQGGSLIGRFVNAAQQTPVPGYSDVYPTAVAGVGIRVSREFEDGLVSAYYPHVLQRPANSRYGLGPGPFRVELIKTHALTGSGPIAPSGRFTTYYADGSGAQRPALTSSFTGLGTTVVSPTCEVQAGSRNIAVDFGSVSNTSFTGVGSRAVNRDFDIHLNCQGGNLAEYQSPVRISLGGTQHVSNMFGVLALLSVPDSASRIGIEMVRRDGSSERELRLGQHYDIGTTTVGNSTLTLPLRARYVQTQPGPVGAGIARGRATFTIHYP